MNSIESLAAAWAARGWLLILAFTTTTLLVAMLRRPCRRLFGAERAFQLWLLPPLAMLASQLPHAATPNVVVLPPLIYTITSATTALPAHAATPGVVDWRTPVMLLWLAGVAACLLRAALAQWRYRVRLRGATPVATARARWPLLRAASPDVGPALVGAWRSHIVLPADFEQRYDATEQMLILAHESTHARRRDGWWCLLAQLAAAAFWFHPMAWWALAALRHDQELACDAAVLREHGTQRRSYANAMLKTQSAAFALPVGCPWSPRHPVTERIIMLKLKQPGSIRRHAGGALVALLAIGVVGIAYATAPSSRAVVVGATAERYTLKVDVAAGTHPDSMHFTYCLKPGEYADANGVDVETGKLSWKGRFAVAPVTGGQLEIRTQVDTRFEREGGMVREQSGQPILRTLPGRQATVLFGQVAVGQPAGAVKPDDGSLRIGLTPLAGCSGDGDRSPAATPAAGHAAVGEYQLNLSFELARDDDRSSQARRANLALCTAAGRTASVKVHDWLIDATPVVDGDGRLQVDLAIAGANREPIAKARLRGALAELLHADGRGLDGQSRYSVEMTPLVGCPARTAAAASTRA